MARQADAPHTKRALMERAHLEMETARELPTFDDVEQCLWILEESQQVTRSFSSYARVPVWRLTQQGKLNEGKA